MSSLAFFITSVMSTSRKKICPIQEQLEVAFTLVNLRYDNPDDLLRYFVYCDACRHNEMFAHEDLNFSCGHRYDLLPEEAISTEKE